MIDRFFFVFESYVIWLNKEIREEKEKEGPVCHSPLVTLLRTIIHSEESHETMAAMEPQQTAPAEGRS